MLEQSFDFNDHADIAASKRKLLAVCDVDENTNVVTDQIDWEVPPLRLSAVKKLCKDTQCTHRCEKCIITRIMTELSN